MVYTWARGYQQNASLVTKERPPQTGEIQRGQKGDLYVHPLSPPTLLSPPKKKTTTKETKQKKTLNTMWLNLGCGKPGVSIKT